jgi:hypothetical protein
MQNEPQDSTQEQKNSQPQETSQEQPSIDSAHTAMVKRYGFTPQQEKEMSLYL